MTPHGAPRVPRGPGRDDPGGEAVGRAHLARVREDVGDETLRRYARAYLALLPERLDLIERAVIAGEGAEAVKVMFDLRVSSAMLGAARLAALISAFESSLLVGLPAGSAQVAVLRVEADAVAEALGAALNGGPAQEPNR